MRTALASEWTDGTFLPEVAFSEIAGVLGNGPNWPDELEPSAFYGLAGRLGKVN